MLFEEVADYYSKLEGISSRLEMIDVLTEMFKKANVNEVRNIIYMSTGMLAPPFAGIDFGMAEKLAEEAIMVATGTEKQKVIDSFRKTGDLGLTAEHFAANTKLRRMNSGKLESNEVFEILLKIAKTGGGGSQDIKIKTLASLLWREQADRGEIHSKVRARTASARGGGRDDNGGSLEGEDRGPRFQGQDRGGVQHLQRPRTCGGDAHEGGREGRRELQGYAFQPDKAGTRGEAAYSRGDTREDAREVRGREQVRRPQGTGARRQEGKASRDILAQAREDD